MDCERYFPFPKILSASCHIRVLRCSLLNHVPPVRAYCVAYTSMLHALATCHPARPQEAEEILEIMEKRGMKPDVWAYTNVRRFRTLFFFACQHRDAIY